MSSVNKGQIKFKIGPKIRVVILAVLKKKCYISIYDPVDEF